VNGEPSSFDRTADLDPLLAAKLPLDEHLPVNVFTRYVMAKTKASRTHARSVANLYQTVLEIDRDGDLLQDLLQFYIDLGAAVYVGQLGLPGSVADMLVAARELAPQTCACPYAVDEPAWQITGKKVWIWAEKNLHIRDGVVLAREMLREKEIQRLIPAIKAMPAQKIAIIGHSFTMPVNWSSPSSFTQIVIEMFAQLNPAVQFKHWSRGGLSASGAKELFYQQALDWKSDRAFIFTLAESDADFQAYEEMSEGFANSGSHLYIFPHNGPMPYNDVQKVRRFAKEHNLELADFDDVVQAAPNKAEFVSLDKIHMTEPFHRLMAGEFLKFLVKG